MVRTLAGTALLALIFGALLTGVLQPVAATILGSLVVIFLIAHARYAKRNALTPAPSP